MKEIETNSIFLLKKVFTHLIFKLEMKGDNFKLNINYFIKYSILPNIYFCSNIFIYLNCRSTQ